MRVSAFPALSWVMDHEPLALNVRELLWFRPKRGADSVGVFELLCPFFTQQTAKKNAEI